METMDNEILQALSARKSVRVYTDEPVTEAERDAILQAAFQAPTAGNQQLYTILNITDPALKARLADLCDHQPFIAKAPLVLVFLADCRRWLQAYKAAGIEDVRTPGVGDLLLAMADTCIAAQNAVVAAESLGIGICYIGGLNADGKPKDTRTEEQKASLFFLLQQLREQFPDAMICGHRDFSPDLNGDGIIEPWEWMKACPCFDAIDEYQSL